MTAKRDCAHCPDGHMRPDAKPWGAFVSPSRDGDGQPLSVTVMHSAGEHVAESDAEWIRGRLNRVDEPGEALDTLDKLAGADWLGKYLPGLGDVAQVLRGQIAEALIEKARDDEAAARAEIAAEARAPVVRGRSMRATRLGPDGKPTGSPPVVLGGDLNVSVGKRPTDEEYRERLAAARAKRGIKW